MSPGPSILATASHAGDWTVFQPFGLKHATVFLISTALMVGFCWLGRRLGEGAARRRAELAVAWSIVAFQVAHLTYWFLPENFLIGTSLPLHLCDLASVTAALMLFTNARWLRAVLYFWAIGLSTQAFFTPTLTDGVATLLFWFFWIGHLQIVGVAVYDVAVRGFRPTGRDFLIGVGASVVWASTAMLVNLLLGTNYGFIGSATPENPTIVDHLGPWPWRVGVLGVIVTSLFAALWLVWPMSATLGRLARRGAQGV
ncbi:MAG: TIGR02206 family membrane protein [Phycisphaerales bacterium]|nr:MAG: TIGR02206 family membrane protein [Phycisphaerales bacterium]